MGNIRQLEIARSLENSFGLKDMIPSPYFGVEEYARLDSDSSGLAYEFRYFAIGIEEPDIPNLYAVRCFFVRVDQLGLDNEFLVPYTLPDNIKGYFWLS